MKIKFILLAVFVATFLSGFAQQPTNGSFENWSGTNTWTPTGWTSVEDLINPYIPFQNSVFTFKDLTTYTQGVASLKLVTDTVPGHSQDIGITSGLASLGTGTLNPNNGHIAFAGVPFAHRPDTLIFDYELTSPASDTAGVILKLTKAGNTQVLANEFYLTKNLAWQTKSFPLSAYYASGQMPDTLYLQFYSSQSGNPIIGTTLHVDNVRFGYGAQAIATIYAAITTSGSNVCNGDSVLLTANTSSVYAYTYQWKLSGIPITGATSVNYYARAAGTYTVTVDSAGTLGTAQPVIITANCSSNFSATISPPTSTNVCNGDSILLSAANTGMFYMYQWRLSGIPITGATHSTYYAKAAGSYTIKIDSASATATSLPVVITANCASGSITATITPSGTNVCNGDSVLLSANNNTNYTFQWYVGGNTIAGATASTYYAKAAGSYTVTIDSASATATSQAVVITANCASGTITATIQHTGSNVCPGDSVVLTANSGTSYTYQWKAGGTAITGATSNTYAAKAAGSYTVTIDSASATGTSAAVTITDTGCVSGINNIAADNFSVYPNPATSVLNILSTENLAGYNLRVYDLVGRLIKNQVLTGTNNIVDVANLTNGTYIYRITDKENGVVTQNKFNVIK